MSKPRLYTVRLVRADDAAAYYRLIKDNRMLLDGFFLKDLAFIRSFQETRLYLARVIHEAECSNLFLFVIEDHSSATLIGSVQVRNIDRLASRSEIGFYLDKQATGKNILFRAVGEVIDFCFYSRKINKLVYMSKDSNRSGRKIAERNGFAYDNITHLQWQESDETVIHIMQYSLINPINQ